MHYTPYRAFPIADALNLGADIVVTGRCVDSALALAPFIHKVGMGLMIDVRQVVLVCKLFELGICGGRGEIWILICIKIIMLMCLI